ncbi:MAG: helix-turn-helix transcriptional regulator [Victivallaceae bacterium]|nr:helix-turn-helix transcriptional regulator [Victivallaceae bacterium]MDD3703322.1 helix-turn-helix transcriptional regulator [Victivallaceae bacterium]MDD4317195.1 helix-turn-helix transcriptional regulator [Victivallaceae bacterium]NLK83439.1 helix-turn-helix transcriptional regulator [Lentisphaerota bacterium]
MNKEKLYRFDYQLTPVNPFQISQIKIDRPEVIPTVIDIHKAIHLGIITGGQMLIQNCGATLELNQGDCYLISPWEPHGVLRHRAGLEILLVSISRDELLKSFISKANFIRQLLTLPPKERMSIINIPAIMESAKVLAERLTAINVNYNDWNKLTQWHLITGFFISAAPLLKIAPDTPYAGRLEPAIELLLGRSGVLTTVSEAAASCSLSESRFNHLFKETFGIAFGNYELHYRLNGAAESLVIENLTLKEVARRWGFFDESHFSHCFKKYFAQTPGTYRKNRQKPRLL